MISKFSIIFSENHSLGRTDLCLIILPKASINLFLTVRGQVALLMS